MEMGVVAQMSLKGRMTDSTVLNHGKWRLIGSKKADKKMIGLEGVMQRTKSSLTQVDEQIFLVEVSR